MFGLGFAASLPEVFVDAPAQIDGGAEEGCCGYGDEDGEDLIYDTISLWISFLSKGKR